MSSVSLENIYLVNFKENEINNRKELIKNKMTIMSLKNCSGFLGNTFGGEQSTKPVCPSIVSPPELPKLKSNAAAALKMLVPNI